MEQMQLEAHLWEGMLVRKFNVWKTQGNIVQVEIVTQLGCRVDWDLNSQVVEMGEMGGQC